MTIITYKFISLFVLLSIVLPQKSSFGSIKVSAHDTLVIQCIDSFPDVTIEGDSVTINCRR